MWSSSRNFTMKKTTSSSYPKWYFQIFSTPNIHSFIICPKFMEVQTVHGKQTSCHCWWAAENSSKTLLSSLFGQGLFCVYRKYLVCFNLFTLFFCASLHSVLSYLLTLTHWPVGYHRDCFINWTIKPIIQVWKVQ